MAFCKPRPYVGCGGYRTPKQKRKRVFVIAMRLVAVSQRKPSCPRRGRTFGKFSGRGGRGSNHRDQSESAPILSRPRGRAVARTEMPSSGAETAGKPLGLAETGSWGVGATTGWRRHFDWGWTAEPVHVEPL